MKSFELLDTLFTRYCKQEDLFGYIEKNYPYPEFQSRRIHAEFVARERHGLAMTLDHIYDIFKELTLEDCTLDTFDLLKEYEFNLELENSIPIQCNINLIDPDDIFIVDSYFTEVQFNKLLNRHGIHEKKLYRITDSDIPETDTHIGHRIERVNLKLTNAYLFTSTETLLYDSPIQKKIRAFRLKNPYPEENEDYKRYHDQACYSFPILLLFCLHIQKIVLKENRNKVLFCKNGIYQMFSVVFPEIESIPFSTSPIIHLHPTLSYKGYVQKLYQDKATMIVDLYGFFQKDGYLYKDIFGCIPRVHLLVHDLQCDFPSLSSSIESSQLSMEYIDSLSYDSRGILFSMIEGSELRLHETIPTPSLDMICSFSKEFTGLETIDLEIQPILLKLIEIACLK